MVCEHKYMNIRAPPPIIELAAALEISNIAKVACHELVVVQTISDLLEQLVASLLPSPTLLQDDNNLFRTCQQL
jgi:hypothetical protein